MAFMDVMMPGRNGVESFMEIRKLKPDARVFMMTGYSVEQLLQQAVDNGAMGVLTKPVDIDKLLRAVNEAAPAGIVLIGDDDPGCGRQIKSLMDEAGYECDLLRNEEDFARDDSKLLIIDTGKPLIDGMDIYARVRRQGMARPAIIVTRPGPAGGDALSGLRDVTVTGILNKPFDPLALLGQLNTLAVQP
jgi:DNA-binding response OmpR family regulator